MYNFINKEDPKEAYFYDFLKVKNIKHGYSLEEKYQNMMECLAKMHKKMINIRRENGNVNKNILENVTNLKKILGKYKQISVHKLQETIKIGKILINKLGSVDEVLQFYLSYSLFLRHYTWITYKYKIDFLDGFSRTDNY